jgi:MerR family copper efflux transcriptional regulator
MTEPTSDVTGLVPIDEVARSLGLRASAIRYYEQRGLLSPASRQSGRRWYGPAGIRRLAIIRHWQEAGRMSLEEIADILAGPGPARRWAHVVEDRIEALRVQIEQMQAACGFLQHVLEFHPDAAPDGCAYFEAHLQPPRPSDGEPPGTPRADHPRESTREAAVTWALTKDRHNSESQAMRPAAGSQCGVRRSIRGEEWK